MTTNPQAHETSTADTTGSPRPKLSDIEALRSVLRGALVAPSDDAYDEARAVWNATIDKRPAVVARCSGVADVIDALAFARKHALPLAVRGGGHNVAGHGTCDGGMVIDLSRMNQVHVDAAQARVRVAGGAVIGDVDRETLAFGLAVPLGVVSMTGIAGLTLCGGHSWLTRKHGFACDNLISADVVTAEGDLLTASEKENADLFWAIRGGGGNFGIVTSFEFQAHPVGPQVTLCLPIYAAERSAEVLGRWRDIVAEAPDDFTANIAVWSIPPDPFFPEELHGRAVIIAAGVHCGPLEEGERFVKPLRALGEPLIDASGPLDYREVQQMDDPFFQKGERLHYWKSIYLDTLHDDAIDIIARRAMERPSPWTLMPLRQMGGAPARVPEGATALGGRKAPFMLSIDTSWTEPETTDEAIAWTRDFWNEMRPFSSGAVYLNFPGQGEDSEAMLRASYGDANYKRLVEAKNKYDPTNMFRLNQNIVPTK